METCKNLFQERLDGIVQLNNETSFDYNTASKRFDDFDNWIKLFEKLKSGDLKLGEVKQNTKRVSIKPRQNIIKGYKLEEHEYALQNFKIFIKQ